MTDTRDRRASAIGVGLSFVRVLPDPDGLPLDLGDRAQVALSYRPRIAVVLTPSGRRARIISDAVAIVVHSTVDVLVSADAVVQSDHVLVPVVTVAVSPSAQTLYTPAPPPVPATTVRTPQAPPAPVQVAQTRRSTVVLAAPAPAIAAPGATVFYRAGPTPAPARGRGQ